MPILDKRHDFMHAVEGDSAWSESYYFNAYDPSSDTGLFTRIGIRPNEGTMDASLCVWLPGHELATIRAIRPQHEMIASVLQVEGVRYECVAPMKEWRIAAEGEAHVHQLSGERSPRKTNLSLDLRFHALSPAIGVDGQNQKGSGQVWQHARAWAKVIWSKRGAGADLMTGWPTGAVPSVNFPEARRLTE